MLLLATRLTTAALSGAAAPVREASLRALASPPAQYRLRSRRNHLSTLKSTAGRAGSDFEGGSIDPELAAIFSDPFKGDPFWESVVASRKEATKASSANELAAELADELDFERQRAAQLELELADTQAALARMTAEAQVIGDRLISALDAQSQIVTSMSAEGARAERLAEEFLEAQRALSLSESACEGRAAEVVDVQAQLIDGAIEASNSSDGLLRGAAEGALTILTPSEASLAPAERDALAVARRELETTTAALEAERSKVAALERAVEAVDLELSRRMLQAQRAEAEAELERGLRAEAEDQLREAEARALLMAQQLGDAEVQRHRLEVYESQAALRANEEAPAEWAGSARGGLVPSPPVCDTSEEAIASLAARVSPHSGPPSAGGAAIAPVYPPSGGTARFAVASDSDAGEASDLHWAEARPLALGDGQAAPGSAQLALGSGAEAAEEARAEVTARYPWSDAPPVPLPAAPLESRAAAYNRVFRLGGEAAPPAAAPVPASEGVLGAGETAAGGHDEGAGSAGAPAGDAAAASSPQPPSSPPPPPLMSPLAEGALRASEVPMANATPQDVVLERLRNRNRRRPAPTVDSAGRVF